MRRWCTSVAMLIVSICLCAGLVSAKGADVQYVGVAEGKIRYVNAAQQLIQLEDGTVLRASDARQMAVFHEGTRVRVHFVSDANQKVITRIESVTP
jgi:hypothetical protein